MKYKELFNFDQFKMNKIIDNFVLTRDKFISEVHLKQGDLLKILKELKNLEEHVI